MKKIRYILLFMFICSSCAKWLDIQPVGKEDETKKFSTERGFKSALTGVYIQMKSPQLYGKNLTMGMLEFMAQNWKTNASQLDGFLSNYDYTNTDVEKLINDTYEQLYNTIVKINNIIAFVDNGVLKDKEYALIKGEALALRAYIHLDILRLFGPIPGTQTKDDKILVYAKTVTKTPLPAVTWDEFTRCLETDLKEAERLLKNIDLESIPNDDFYKYRENRMNYYAVQALQARFYRWIQELPKASQYALNVITHSGKTLSTTEDIAQRHDYISSKEILFAIHVYNLEEISEDFIYRPGGVSMNEKQLKKELFNSDPTDVRISSLWKNVTETSSSRFILMKYKQGTGISNNSKEQIPLIRLYEMYLIAIDNSEDPDEYNKWVKLLISARNVSQVPDLSTPESKNAFVQAEFHREFYGEGQQFFQYKLHGTKNILWTNREGSRSIYELPIPKSELNYIK